MEDKEFFPTKKGMDLSLAKADPSAIAAAETVKSRIQAAYIMALQKPRDEMEARDRILTACKRTEFAGKAEYSRPQGKKSIKGPSIRFAELALREWGNILSEVQTLYDDESLRRVRVSVLDLETNAQFSKDLQIKKTVERKFKKGREDDVIGERKNSYGDTIYILTATDEEMYTKEAAWVSRILRNEGLRLIPTDIIEEGMKQARQTVANKAVQDPEGEKKKLLDAFSSIGVKPKELEKYIKHTLDTLSPPEIVNLRVVYQSIRDGESTWLDYSSANTAEEPKGNNNGVSLNDAVFDNLILKETGKKAKDIEHLANFIETIANKQEPKMSSSQLMEAITAENFSSFWKRFKQYVETLNAKTKPDLSPDLDNAFDNIDWVSSRLREQGVVDFYWKNKDAFGTASEKAQKGFRDKWARVSSNPFPADKVEEKKESQEQVEQESLDDPRDTEGAGLSLNPISPELSQKFDELKTKRPDLYGKATQVFGIPENDEDCATVIQWISEIIENE